MNQTSKPKRPKARTTPRSRKRDAEAMNQATGEEFEREGMGIAAKE